MPAGPIVTRAEPGEWNTVHALGREHGIELPGRSPRDWLEDGCVLLGRYEGHVTGMLFVDPTAARVIGRPRFSEDFSRRSGRRLVEAAERRAVRFGLLALDAVVPPADEPFWTGCGYVADRGSERDAHGRPLLTLHRSFPRRRTQLSRQVTRWLKRLGIPRDYGAQRRLPMQAECERLASIGRDIHDRDQRLHPAAALAWQRMRDAAGADRITLQPVSAFRTIDYQAGIVERKLQAGQSIDEILSVSAAPGFSEHHSGYALDVTTPGSDALETSFEDTDAFRWLQSNAGDFGFRLSYPAGNRHGVAYEPWHWCWKG